LQRKSFLIILFIGVFLASVIIGGTRLIRNNIRNSAINSYQGADTLFQNSQYAEALEIFESIKDKVKGEIKTDILYKMGSCYQKTGRTDKAEECWNEILNSSYLSYHPVVYFELAKQRLTEGNFDEAEFYYSKIIKEFPSHPLAEDAILGPVDICIAKKELIKAQEYCEKIIETTTSHKVKEIAIDKLGDIDMQLLFSPTPTNISKVYTVQMGDTLSKISKEFNTTIVLLQEANNIKGSFIKVGQSIKVTPGRFSIVINTKENELFLNYKGQLFKRYKIASGANDSPTPLGEFTIKDKMKDPPWYPLGGGVIPPDSAENILGSRWMGLWESGIKTHYGIHEAVDPSDIGKHVSEGCVRMIKEDLEQLYNVVTIGTPVKIINSSIENSEKVASVENNN
jgi:lipoprotein-anchoring transpeptidase ErfK/SrfK